MNYDEAKQVVLNQVSPRVGERWRYVELYQVTAVKHGKVYWKALSGSDFMGDFVMLAADWSCWKARLDRFNELR